MEEVPDSLLDMLFDCDDENYTPGAGRLPTSDIYACLVCLACMAVLCYDGQSPSQPPMLAARDAKKILVVPKRRDGDGCDIHHASLYHALGRHGVMHYVKCSDAY